MQPSYAHSLADHPESDWEGLSDHLQKVGDLASGFASAFDSADWGRLAGLWHDLGKYHPKFQERLRGSGEQVEHAGLGAVLAVEKDRALGRFLAFVIAGHHAGLANPVTTAETSRRSLEERLDRNAPVLASLRSQLPPKLTALAIPRLPRWLSDRPEPSSLELWTRLLFSALVDADFLATESFYKPGTREAAIGPYDDVATLRKRLDSYLDRKVANLPEEERSSLVNRKRAEVLAACREKATYPPGLFSLTVPTGGGKTLAAMSFALRHAEKHGLRRVVVGIPFTSIIEQNAKVYREALDDANVLEHHSALDPLAAEEKNREAELRRRLAAENWDAPIVVTTNVQLFESLFADRPSRCRKLHRIARSVILLDEAQTLPVDFLDAVLDVLRELTQRYGCSVVLTTATQPALKKRSSLPQGLEEVEEIIADPTALAENLERVEVSWPDVDGPARTYSELARELVEHERVLAVVHLRRDARTLAELLPREGRFHLSALMCPAHRTQELDKARARLATGKPCRLVSTQLIEAGVDIDFPVVYRCLGGLDSLAQAAGRCNREGKLLPDKGRVVFFRAETSPPPGVPRKGLKAVEEMLRDPDIRLNLSDPEAHTTFFRMLYAACERDPRRIQRERRELNFATVGRLVRLIDEPTTPVVVPFGDAMKRLDRLRRVDDRLHRRSLQPFVVNLRERTFQRLQTNGAIEEVVDGVFTLTGPYHHLYDEQFGLTEDDEPSPDPERLVV